MGKLAKSDRDQILISSTDLQLINFWSRSGSRWPAELTDLSKHKSGFKSVNFTYIKLRFSVAVAENPLQHIFQVWTDCTSSLFQTLVGSAAKKNNFPSRNVSFWYKCAFLCSVNYLRQVWKLLINPILFNELSIIHRTSIFSTFSFTNSVNSSD